MTAQTIQKLNTVSESAGNVGLNGTKIMLLHCELTIEARVYLKSAPKLAAYLQEILGNFRSLCGADVYTFIENASASSSTSVQWTEWRIFARITAC